MSVAAIRSFRYWALRYRRQWVEGLVVSFAQPLLYLAAVGFGLGRLVDERPPVSLGGVRYAAYIAPGLLAAAAMQTASRDSTWAVIAAVQEKHTYQAMLATPLGVADVLLGHLLWNAARIGIAATAYFLAVVAFGLCAAPIGVLAVPAAVLTGAAVAAPIMAYGATVVGDDASPALIERLIIVPAFLLSGTFFPVAALPEWLRAVAYCTPLWHGAELCRGFLLDRVTVSSVLGHLAYLLAFTALGVAAGLRTYRRRLAR